MIKKLFLLGVGLAAGHVLEHRGLLFARMLQAKHMLIEEERQLARAVMQLTELREGFNLWLETEEAQKMIRRQRDEIAEKRRAAQEQAATS
jgi:hypothetical protein